MAKIEHNDIHNDYLVGDCIIHKHTHKIFEVTEVWGFPAHVSVKCLNPSDRPVSVVLEPMSITYQTLKLYYIKLTNNAVAQILYKK